MRNPYIGVLRLLGAPLLLISASCWAAEAPVASAPIPPPLPDTPHLVSPHATKANPAPKTETATKPAKPASTASAIPPKKPAHPADHAATARKTATAQHTARPKRPDWRRLVARAYPPRRSTSRPRYYSGDFMPGAGSDFPPVPPPWYYASPRGPW